MDIEDRATPAFMAYQPVSLTGVPESERTAANLAPRHRQFAAWTERTFAGDKFLADLFQLRWGVLGLATIVVCAIPRRMRIFAHSGIRTTIFPNC
jgi:hypothetical protein